MGKYLIMTKFWLVSLIDRVFVSVAVFLLIFAWINFYVADLWVSFAISLVFTFAVLFLIYFFVGKKNEKAALNRKQIEEMNKFTLAFRLSKESEQKSLLKSILEKNFEVEMIGRKLTYKDALGNHLVILATEFKKLSENDLINLMSKHFDKKFDCFDIFCNELDFTPKNIFKDKKIFIYDKRKIYQDFFKKTNIYPDCSNLDDKISKFSCADFLKNLFLPAKAKSYFLCGLILIFSSIILPFHIYYLIFASGLMIFAIICKIMPIIKNRQNK